MSDSESDSSYEDASVASSAGEPAPPLTPEAARSAAELLQAHAAGENRADLMRAARHLRDGLERLPSTLRDALFKTPAGAPLAISTVDGPNVDVKKLAISLAVANETGSYRMCFFVLDEILVVIHAGSELGVRAAAYDRRAVLAAGTPTEGLNTAIPPLSMTALRSSSQDMHLDEVAMSLTFDFEVDADGFWKCDWIPLPDGGGWSLSRSEEVVAYVPPGDDVPPGHIPPDTSDDDLNCLFCLHARAFSNEFIGDIPPPGARKRQRRWDQRKVHVLLRARAAAAGLSGPLASLYDIPEELFRAVVMCL